MGETQWLPALVALGFGLVLASAILLRTRGNRAGPRTSSPAVPPVDLETRAGDLIQLLSEIGPDDTTDAQRKERYAKELEAATLLRDSVARAGQQAASQAPKAEAPRRSGLTLVLTGAWAGATVVLLAVFLRDQARPAPPDMSGMMPAASAVAADPTLVITGVVEVDPSTAPLPPGAAIFLIARAGQARQGMPVMAAKANAATGALPFRLDSAHGMGGEIPDHVTIEARLDSDGDPMTRDPADPVGYADDIAIGAKDVRLVIKRAVGNGP